MARATCCCADLRSADSGPMRRLENRSRTAEAIRRRRAAHRTLGIVGLGAIGSLVADIAIKLGMKVTVSIRRSPLCGMAAARSVRKANSIDELEAIRFRDAPCSTGSIDAQSDRRQAVGRNETGRGVAQFRARPPRRRTGGRRRVARPPPQVLFVRLSQRRPDRRTRRRRACPTSALRPKRPRRTAR